MNKPIHTPGEWQEHHFDALESGGNATLVPSGYKKRVIVAIRTDEQRRRCTQYVADVHEQAAHPEQGAANARLITAAPELLKELKRWQKFAKDNHFTDLDYHDADGSGWISAMDVAIAKAEGRS